MRNLFFLVHVTAALLATLSGAYGVFVALNQLAHGNPSEGFRMGS